MIVVIDSGVWISAVHFGGTPWLAAQKALIVDRVAVCDKIKEEIVGVLIKKMRWSATRIQQDLAAHFEGAIWVPIHGDVRGVCRDPDDDAILECAVNSNAELIISGDKDLLSIKEYNRIRIITPYQYIAPPDNGKDLRSR